MATAAPLNLAPPHHIFPSIAAAFPWKTALAMHVTRPKSAKGRTRQRCNYSPGVEACPCRVPPSPPPAAPRGSGDSQSASSTKPAFPASQVSPEEIPKLLQQVPLRTISSLNKYRVLPSIGQSGAAEGLAEQIDQLRVSRGQEDAQLITTLPREQGSASVLSETDVPGEGRSHVPCPLEKLGRKMRQENPSALTLSLEEVLKEESGLLLAVRSPSGRRFQHHFKPTDTLQRVLAVAEQKLLTRYRRCSIETMEVPRRSFSDLTRSLRECGILHKSVLCIRQKERRDADL
ncbi:UBX10 protein, partial [Crotophaga sulcirostris]|nr:UBX10 protein [Crotophaga sulcirostris]